MRAGTVEVFKADGSLVLQASVQGPETAIDLVGQPSGVYFVRHTARGGQQLGRVVVLK